MRPNHDDTEWDIQRKGRSQTEGLGLFAALEARDEGIERADASVAKSVGGDALVARITQRLVAARQPFTGDDIALMLDEMQVPRDQATRKRIVSTIVNRGRGTLWTMDGWTISTDPRRHGRPVMRWNITPEAA